MLYIQGEITKTWPTLSRILADRDDLQMVALLYPGQATPPPPFLPSLPIEELEPVTTWDDDEPHTVSARMPVDSELLDVLSALSTKPSEMQWDFALYPPSEREWVACAVPHEDMVIVRENSLLETLRDAGLSVSEEKPEHW